MTEKPRTNWSTTYRYGFEDYLFPASVEEAQAAVAGARKVKVLGSRHSFNGIVDGEVALVPKGIPISPRIEDDGRRVSIDGHATYGDLAMFLRDHGLAVHNLASLPHISIAGAIATATHGSGDRHGNLATAVRGLEFITADGSLVSVRAGDPDFDGMVVHLGALGVVTRVDLEVQPAFDVRQTVYQGLGWDALLANLDDIMGSGYSVSLITDWGNAAGALWVKDTGSQEVPAEIHGARRALVKRHPIVTMDSSNCTDQLGVPGSWADRLPHFKMGFTPSNGNEIQSEFYVARQHGAAAIEALHAIRGRFAGLVQATEFRTIAADDLWLSPQYQSSTLAMHFTWLPDGQAVDRAVEFIEEALAPFDALPHWGKVFTPAHIGSRYAKLQDFRRIRDRMDPERKFSNAWLEKVVFGLRQ